MLDRPVSHISYAVADLPRAVEFWADTFGAGPFFVLEHVRFDEIECQGGPALLDHTAAFGQWGSIAVELQRVFEASPDPLAELVAVEPPRLNHVAYISPEVAVDSARLERAGMPKFMFGRIGEVEVTFHDATSALGHAIEIHRESDHIHGFFDALKTAAQDWRGEDPLRSGPPS
jgi:catechol 2,3-dioxygenase-like lactoylglutathione lyase family enzyme